MKEWFRSNPELFQRRSYDRPGCDIDLVFGDSLRVRLIRGGLGSAMIQAANRLLALVISMILARTLGPDDYGVYAYALAIMILLMVVTEAGVPTLLMRELAASHGRAEWGLLRGALRRGVQFAALTAITVSLLGLLVLLWLADALQPEVLHTTALMLMALPVATLCKTVAHAMQGLHRVVVGQAVDMLIQPLLVLSIIAVVFMLWPEQRQPHVAMAAQLLGGLLVLLIGALVLRRFLPDQSRTAAPLDKSRLWLKSAVPFTLIGCAGVINSQADIIMIGWFMEPGDVGIYRVAMQGAALVAFGLQAANTVVAPQFARLYAQGDMARLQRLATGSARVILAVALPVALVFIFAGQEIVVWVFGTEYSAAHQPLAILAVGQLINAGFGSVGFLLNMTGHETITARILWLTAGINIVLNLALIPTFGLIGAAAATAVSLAIWNVLLYQQVRTQLKIQSTAI